MITNIRMAVPGRVILIAFVMLQCRSSEARQGMRPNALAQPQVESVGRAGGLAMFVMHNTATLSWEAVEDPRVVGYEVWRGTTPNDLSPNKVGNVTTYTFKGLDQGNIWYFRVSSYDKKGNRSELSNMVMKIIAKIKGPH